MKEYQMSFKTKIAGKASTIFTFEAPTAADAAVLCFQAFFGRRTKLTAEKMSARFHTNVDLANATPFLIKQNFAPTGIIIEVAKVKEDSHAR